MGDELVRAHLNLHAVLQNLEDLAGLDAEAAALTKNWDVSIEFSVRNGPAAHVSFERGVCRFGRGHHPNPSIKLYFTSPRHLNNMFNGKGNPIPLKGFTRLGFLKNEFGRVTDRLSYFLKPGNGAANDAAYRRVSTTLMLHTAAFAVRELALHEGTCREIASHIPRGTLLFEVLPEGPYAHIVFGEDDIAVGKTVVVKPRARMTFRSLEVAADLLGGRLDAFMAVANGDVMLHGQIPMVDSVNLILDRVAAHLA